MEDVFFVKVREQGKRQYRFLTPRGGETHLRVHAAQVEGREKAERVVASILAEGGYEAKAVPAWQPTRR